MITKLILNDSFAHDGPATSLVPLHRRGVDSAWMAKHASTRGVFEDILGDLRPRPNQTVVHVIAVGDEEKYGCNRNCDSFSREDNVTAHRSFKDIGHVFKNHKNRDPLAAVGEVIATAHNNWMSRIELLLGLDNDKCRNEVEGLNRGDDLPVSMGSLQDYDVCSYCGHKAPTAKDHCQHIKNMLGEVLSDGTRVYMRNPRPKYFDISLVFKPADRIAYTLRKVASGLAIGGHELADMAGLIGEPQTKLAVKQVLARMIKEVPLTLRKATKPSCVHVNTIQELRKAASVHGIEHLLAFLSSNGWLLEPSDLAQVAGMPDPSGCGAAADGLDFSELLGDGIELPSLCGSGIDPIQFSPSAREDLDCSCGMNPQAARGRTVRIMIMQPKVATAINSEQNQAFAAFYGHYKVAFAERHADNPAVLRTVATTF